MKKSNLKVNLLSFAGSVCIACSVYFAYDFVVSTYGKPDPSLWHLIKVAKAVILFITGKMAFEKADKIKNSVYMGKWRRKKHPH